MSKKISFEENLRNLENIVNELALGNITLDDTVEKYKKGMDFAAKCSKELQKAEAEINIYMNEQFVPFKDEVSGLS
ncbi:MAG: exodeoxyribonuclease VII small subunit [Candidatus Epulonipiscioides saccharophilum]|nr:MAG: exodeoxyribonuclease VII small subunit [Epulopiscium sp. AS2M-Bin001]